MIPYKILVVEDDPIAVDIYRTALKEDRFKVLIATSFKMALAGIKSMRPDIILIDIHLPDGNGIDLCAKLEENSEFIPQIIVTSDNDIDTLRKAYKAGAIDFITKPFNQMELLFRIENALRIKTLLEKASIKAKSTTVNEMGLSLEHYVGQYLTAIKGAGNLINLKLKPEKPDLQEMLQLIADAADGLEETVQKFKKLDDKYSTKELFHQTKIIDLD